MDTTQRQVALSLLEGLREDLMYAHLNNGSRILDVAPTFASTSMNRWAG